MDDYPHATTARAEEPTTSSSPFPDGRHASSWRRDADLVVKILSRIARVISRRMRQTTNQVVNAAAQYISGRTRREHDLLGERDVPSEFYYGIQTLRATENFPITGISIARFPDLIVALAQVKMAAARANRDARPAARGRRRGHRPGLPGDHRRPDGTPISSWT